MTFRGADGHSNAKTVQVMFFAAVSSTSERHCMHSASQRLRDYSLGWIVVLAVGASLENATGHSDARTLQVMCFAAASSRS
eukprot:8590989-Pyramimonas_sp.AAC.1